MKKFQCENCGAALVVDDTELTATCEYCGTTVSLPDTYPEYAESLEEEQDPESNIYVKTSVRKSQKGLRIVLIMVLAVFLMAGSIILAVFSGIHNTYQKSYTAEQTLCSWPTTGLATRIPEPSSLIGEVLSDSSEHFSAVFYGVAQEDFDSYASECKERGFDLESEGSDSSFTAYSADGSYLELYYWAEEQELSIYIDAPENKTVLSWPKDGLAAKLPKPAAEYGGVVWGDAENISILVYVDSKEEFEQYKDSCRQYGFTENHAYHFSDDGYGWYAADDKDGYHLDLDFEDRFYKKMQIRLEKN